MGKILRFLFFSNTWCSLLICVHCSVFFQASLLQIEKHNLQRATYIGLAGTKSDTLSLMSFCFSNILYFTVKTRELGLENHKETFLHEFKKAHLFFFWKKNNWVYYSHMSSFKKSHQSYLSSQNTQTTYMKLLWFLWVWKSNVVFLLMGDGW